MDRERFDKLIAEAVESLPPEFKERLENIDVAVQDWPTRRQLVSVGLRNRWQLMGLYEGIPLTAMGRSHAAALPDKITIFRKPIELAYRTEGRIVRGIAETVRHEIAHHFGIGDGRLSEIARQRRKEIDHE
jgi:predicted Zn-dependent protease with MMP-like domain